MKKELKTAIITGGTKGIGAEIARQFYHSGYFVIIGARHTSERITALGPRLRFIKADVRKESDHLKLIRAAQKATGRVDVYINAAGLSAWKPVGEVDEKFWDLVIDTNLKGVLWGCKIASKYLARQGCIINLNSLAGKRGTANNAVYCASKFGVTAITQALAKELGPKGIRINAVCPVYVKTEGLMKALKDKRSPASGKNIESFLETFGKQNSALGFLPTARDVARICLFLASPEATAITGQSLNVDCGVLPQ